MEHNPCSVPCLLWLKVRGRLSPFGGMGDSAVFVFRAEWQGHCLQLQQTGGGRTGCRGGAPEGGGVYTGGGLGDWRACEKWCPISVPLLSRVWAVLPDLSDYSPKTRGLACMAQPWEESRIMNNDECSPVLIPSQSSLAGPGLQHRQRRTLHSTALHQASALTAVMVSGTDRCGDGCRRVEKCPVFVVSECRDFKCGKGL